MASKKFPFYKGKFAKSSNSVEKKSRAGKLWTDAEEETVKKLIEKGESHEDIAKEINRTPLAVKMRCVKLASTEMTTGGALAPTLVGGQGKGPLNAGALAPTSAVYGGKMGEIS